VRGVDPGLDRRAVLRRVPRVRDVSQGPAEGVQLSHAGAEERTGQRTEVHTLTWGQGYSSSHSAHCIIGTRPECVHLTTNCTLRLESPNVQRKRNSTLY